MFFDYPSEIRKVIYTTNAIESFNASLRQVTKTGRSFPNDDAVLKLLYLALHQIAKKVDNATTRLEASYDTVYDHVR